MLLLEGVDARLASDFTLPSVADAGKQPHDLDEHGEGAPHGQWGGDRVMVDQPAAQGRHIFFAGMPLALAAGLPPLRLQRVQERVVDDPVKGGVSRQAGNSNASTNTSMARRATSRPFCITSTVDRSPSGRREVSNIAETSSKAACEGSPPQRRRDSSQAGGGAKGSDSTDSPMDG